MRTDLRREIEAEVRAELKAEATPARPEAIRNERLADRLETWLAANVGRVSFARRPAYDAPKSKPASPPPPKVETPRAAEPTVRATTVEDMCALELLLRVSGSKLQSEFTASQLKGVWRRAALKTHPDRFANEDRLVQMQKAALFRELASAYEHLQYLFEGRSAA